MLSNADRIFMERVLSSERVMETSEHIRSRGLTQRGQQRVTETYEHIRSEVLEQRDQHHNSLRNSDLIAESMRTNIWPDELEARMIYEIAYHRVRDLLLTTTIQDNISGVPLVHCLLQEEIRRHNDCIMIQLFYEWMDDMDNDD